MKLDTNVQNLATKDRYAPSGDFARKEWPFGQFG